jgi:hypothetical protein
MATATFAPMTIAIKVLYGIGKAAAGVAQTASSINDFLDHHIADLKRSDNPTIACTGRVLEAAKLGFGLGCIGSIAIIATGQ